jgi:hypothetical protein
VAVEHRFPDDSPEWLIKAMGDLEEKASALVRGHPDVSRAAGYFQAVAELQEAFTMEAKLEEVEKRKRFLSVVHGQPTS